MKIKSLRQETKKTQAEIARLLKISQTSYQRYESGIAEPNIAKLIQLADFYHITLDYLVGREFANDAGYLTDDEKRLLQSYRNCSTFDKGVVLGTAEHAASIRHFPN